MSAPDFAAILAATLADVTGEPSRMFDIECTEMLAARVPELCQTCKGYGLVAKPLRPGAQALSVTHEDCPGCPTIGQLLAIGAAVMSARVEIDDYTVAVEAEGRTWHPSHAITLLDRLRAVQP